LPYFNERHIHKAFDLNLRDVKMKLHRTTKGQYYVLLPRDLVRVIKWKKGDEIEIILGSEAEPKKEDLILRRK
jgi:bifunctional DNA-binding transcriptional regulator/antitoxin component of YhaV-PrlF toxin-antitoxin module